jgi:hypothetical protein
MSIWTILFVVLLIAWLGGFTVFTWPRPDPPVAGSSRDLLDHALCLRRSSSLTPRIGARGQFRLACRHMPQDFAGMRPCHLIILNDDLARYPNRLDPFRRRLWRLHR